MFSLLWTNHYTQEHVVLWLTLQLGSYATHVTCGSGSVIRKGWGTVEMATKIWTLEESLKSQWSPQPVSSPTSDPQPFLLLNTHLLVKKKKSPVSFIFLSPYSGFRCSSIQMEEWVCPPLQTISLMDVPQLPCLQNRGDWDCLTFLKELCEDPWS